MVFFCACLILLIPLLGAGAAAQDNSWAALVARGSVAFEDGLYLDARRVFADAVERTRKEAPKSRALSESLIRLADTFLTLAEEEQAEPLVREAVAIDEGRGGAGRVDLARDYECLARVLLARVQVADALGAIQTAESIDRAELGPEHLNTIRDLETWALVEFRRGSADAESRLRQVVVLREAAQGSDHPLVATALTHLVQVLLARGQHNLAEQPMVRARSIVMLNHGPEHIELVPLYLADARMMDIARRDSSPVREHALNIVERTFGSGHILTARLAVELAEYQLGFRRYGDVERLLTNALPVISARHGGESAEVARVLFSLGVALSNQGKFAEADSTLKRALGIEEKLRGRDHPDLGKVLFAEANNLYMSGGADQAIAVYERVLKLWEDGIGPGSPDLGINALTMLARIHRSRLRHAEAESALNRLIQLKEQIGGNLSPGLVTELMQLAELYTSQQRHDAAEPLYRRVLDIRELTQPVSAPVAETLERLASLETARRRFDEAEKHFKRAIEVRERALGDLHVSVAQTLESYAVLLRLMGRPEDAESALARAREIRGGKGL